MIRRMLVLLGVLVVLQAVPAVAQQPATTGQAEASQAVLVNINTADATELETLPGVGATLARRILEYREKNGGFEKIEDLMNVQGIGERSFLRLRPLVTVTPPGSNRASSRP